MSFITADFLWLKDYKTLELCLVFLLLSFPPALVLGKFFFLVLNKSPAQIVDRIDVNLGCLR